VTGLVLALLLLLLLLLLLVIGGMSRGGSGFCSFSPSAEGDGVGNRELEGEGDGEVSAAAVALESSRPCADIRDEASASFSDWLLLLLLVAVMVLSTGVPLLLVPAAGAAVAAGRKAIGKGKALDPSSRGGDCCWLSIGGFLNSKLRPGTLRVKPLEGSGLACVAAEPAAETSADSS
jgi:hypothetical protein